MVRCFPAGWLAGWLAGCPVSWGRRWACTSAAPQRAPRTHASFTHPCRRPSPRCLPPTPPPPQVVLLWEEARRSDATPEKRSKLVGAILARVEGRIAALAGSHSAARVIQTCVKHGSPAGTVRSGLVGRPGPVRLCRLPAPSACLHASWPVCPHWQQLACYSRLPPRRATFPSCSCLVGVPVSFLLLLQSAPRSSRSCSPSCWSSARAPTGTLWSAGSSRCRPSSSCQVRCGVVMWLTWGVREAEGC